MDRRGRPIQHETKAKEKLGKAAAGADPFAEEDTARAAETFGNEVERYLQRKRVSMKARSYAEIERHLSNHATPLAKAEACRD